MERFYPNYPLITDTNFNSEIVTKQEFAELKLKKTERRKIPSQGPPNKALTSTTGRLLDHQKYIARFLSAQTGFAELLLWAEPGTGKTCAAVAAIEGLRHDKSSSGVRGALILAKGDGLLRNFLNEQAFVCTDGRYIPDDYDNLPELTQLTRLRKIAMQFYEFRTFETFAKEMAKLSDTAVRQRYENFVIVVDEVHNVRDKDRAMDDDDVDPATAADVDAYAELHRLFHVLERRRVLLMSGTPIKDGPEEFAAVMNLLLPADEQLPTGAAFIKQFYASDGSLLNKAILAKAIKGRVSYLTTAMSDVAKRFIGNRNVGGLQHFIVAEDFMSEFQSAAYTRAYALDREHFSIFNNSRQASLFVFPDGSWGADGFSKFMTQRLSSKTFELRQDLIREINTLDKLRRFSSKYAAVIETLLGRARATPGKHFVYCAYVGGSGAILFARILEQFGFSRAKGTERTKGRRYLLVTAATHNVSKIVQRFNEPDNALGEYMSVIIGSKVLNEGFTLRNISSEFILTGHWNYAETSQAIARGWRFGSHDADVGITAVDVYQCVSIPKSTAAAPSIDLTLYETSERKDLRNRRIERLVKETAFDCPLAEARNKTTAAGLDGQRECDYESCDYQCAGTIGLQLDTSTHDQIEEVRETIDTAVSDHVALVLRTRPTLPIVELQRALPQLSRDELLSSIDRLSASEQLFHNVFGFKQFLRNNDRIVFLSTAPRGATAEAAYYAENIVLTNGDTFNDVLADLHDSSMPARIEAIFSNPQQARELAVVLPKRVQRELLQGCLLAREEGRRKNAAVRDDLLDFYSGFVDNTNGQFRVFLHFDEIGATCFNPTTRAFESCDFNPTLITKSPIGFYGQWNPRLNDFCLRDVRQLMDDTTDLRKVKAGRRCANHDSSELIDIVARKMQIDPPADYMANESTETIMNSLRRARFNVLEDDFTQGRDWARRMLFWQVSNKNSICDAMKKWFTDNDLLEQNFDCGTQKKSRAKFVE